MTCFTTPDKIKEFCEKFFPDAGKNKRGLFPIFITGISLSMGKRTFAALGRAIMTDQRWKTSVGKFFNCDSFQSRELYRGMLRRLIRIYVNMNCRSWEHLLFILDGTCTKRGSKTKVGNALQGRKKKTSGKGRSTKAHTFLMGLLMLPRGGMRLPFTRYTYYTKSYCRKHGRRYRKQTDLTLDMLKELRSYIPRRMKIVVVADNYFDCNKIIKFCQGNNIAFIVPVNSRRNYLDGKEKRKLHEKARYLKDYQTLELIEGEERYTAGHRRPTSENSNGRKKKRVYRVAGQTLKVLKLGDTWIVFSKKLTFGKKGSVKKSATKVLLCSDPSFDAQMVVEFYELRWQIEIFFRELKSELGFCDYAGSNFKAYERFIDMCLISFAFLEWFREDRLKTVRSKKEKGVVKKARTSGMKIILKEYSMKQDMGYIKKCKNFLFEEAS